MKFAIFGAGSSGSMALNYLGYSKVECFVDNHKYGQTYLGKTIVDVQTYLEKNRENEKSLLVIASEQHWPEMEAELKAYHFGRYFVFREHDREMVWDNLPGYRRNSLLNPIIYTAVWKRFHAQQYQKFAVYGTNPALPYLLISLASLTEQYDFSNIIGVVDPYGNYEKRYGIPAISFREAKERADCIIVNVPLEECNDICYQLENEQIPMIDLYDLRNEPLQPLIGIKNLGTNNDSLYHRLERGLRLYAQLRREFVGARLLLFECNSMGDPFFYASLMDEYVEKENIRDYVFLFCRTTMEPLIKTYHLNHYKVLSWRDTSSLHLLYRLMPQNLDLTLLHKTDSALWRVGTAKQMDLLSIIKSYTLGLSKSLPMKSSNGSATDWKSRYPELDGKGVLLVPKAKTVDEKGPAFWQTLTIKLKQHGKKVYCNVGTGEEPLPGTVPLQIALEDIVSVAETIGCVIALRSGFCDLLAEADCRKIILYNDKRVYWNHVDERTVFSLNKCGLCKDADEVCFSKNWKHDVDKILALATAPPAQRMHLVLPMAGEGSRFQKEGYPLPKPLIQLHGKPLFYWAAMSVVRTGLVKDIRFVVLKRHIEQYEMDKVIWRYFPTARIVSIPDVLPGPVHSCLKGIADIEDDLPIVFSDCDHMFSSKHFFETFREKGMDSLSGTLFTFNSQEPQYSYVRYDTDGRFAGTVEKKVVSDHAIYGAYGFRSAKLFRWIAKEYIANCDYAECFMSGMYNVLASLSLPVGVYPVDFHLEFGTPKELSVAEQDCSWQKIEGKTGIRREVDR